MKLWAILYDFILFYISKVITYIYELKKTIEFKIFYFKHSKTPNLVNISDDLLQI